MRLRWLRRQIFSKMQLLTKTPDRFGKENHTQMHRPDILHISTYGQVKVQLCSLIIE